MGYVYRPMIKGKAASFTPTADDIALSRGRPGDDPKRCHHPRHGHEDVCPGCGARFSPVWWLKYYLDGRPVRQSSETEKETEARSQLKRKEGDAASGRPVLPRADRTRYEEAAKDLRTHYQTTGARDLREADKRLKHLERFFRTKRVSGIGPAETATYIAARQADGAANGTVNRELAVLGRMLKLAYENGKLLRLPILRKLKEAAPRAGFFERAQFEAVKRHLRPDLQVAVSIAYAFGWRMQSEVLTLKRSQVDLNACTIRLEPGTTKNDDGRLVYLTPELVELLQAQAERIQCTEMLAGRALPYLFPNLEGRHRGQRINDFRKAWAEACLEATLDLDGLEGTKRAARKGEFQAAIAAGEKPGLLKMLRHDFRRTAVRNLVNRGVPERVAMKITGHKTRSVFDRYDITSTADLRDAARRLDVAPRGDLRRSRRSR
jgi:integrase